MPVKNDVRKKGKLSEFEIKKTYFHGNKAYGRTTTIIHKPTGLKREFMGDVPKKEAAKLFFYHKKW